MTGWRLLDFADFSARRRVTVALLSDTHGVLDKRIAQATKECDIAAHGGDVGSALVLQALKPRSGVIVAVRGNNDTPTKWPANERAWLQRLPVQSSIDLPGGRLVLVHGHQYSPAKRRHEILRKRFPQARAIAYGHSHRLIVDDAEQPWVLNPGAAGKGRTFGSPSYLLLKAGKLKWTVEAIRYDPVVFRR